MKKFTACLLAATVASTLSVSTHAEDSSSIAEALKAGKTKLHFRLRYEDVTQDSATPGADDLEADALTLKTRLTYTSGTYNGLGLTLEMDDTTAITDEDYTNGVTPVPGSAVIADPEVTEINQAYLSYTYGATTGKWGRQRINLDNQRFVGGVGWRQDEQTYSGLSLASKPVEGLSLFYGYITEVNRIFAEAGDHNHDTHLLNASYQTPFGKIVGYGYLIDNDTALNLSSDTFGVRWEGKAGDIFKYNLEFASQSEAGDNPNDYSADYSLAEVMTGIPIGKKKLNLKLGYELLGSDDGNAAFTTSLATLHKFQGWTDKFLGTPATGIEDIYFSVGSKFGPVNATVVYHDYKADEGDLDYGDEIGFVLKTKFKGIGYLLKYSSYGADDFATDTDKLWLQAAATF